LLRPASEGENAAAVHEHQLTVGKSDKDAIALAYINGGDLERLGVGARPEPMPDHLAEQRENNRRGGDSPYPRSAL
jgi:hypothetical protein